MLEEEFRVVSFDGAQIIGRVSQSGKALSNKSVLMVHGYPSLINNALFEVSKREFTKNGFDVLRFSFFGSQSGQRAVGDITLALMSEDLKAVIEHFKGSYHNNYILGHSYGGLVLAMTNPDGFNAFSFWDPTWAPYKGSWIEYATFNEDLDAMILDGPLKMITGVKAYEEALCYDHDKCKAYAAKLSTPSQVILAEKQPEYMDRTQLYHCLKSDLAKELHTISGSSHSFTEANLIEELVNKTSHWFKAFL